MASETFPVSNLKTCEWLPITRQTAPMNQGGSGQVIEMGDPYWMIQCAYENLNEADYRALTAFLARRNGAMVPFRAYRSDRQMPLNIPNADSLSPSISQVSSGVMQITTGTNKLSEGDMVAYAASDGSRYVGEIKDILSTQTSSVQCELFPIAPTPASSADLQIYRAEGLFTLEPGSIQTSEPIDKRRSVSFSARQLEKPFTEPA